MRNAALLLGIVLVLFFAGLLVAPQLVDLDRFKAPIAAQLGGRTGHPVDIAGPITLSLLPSPAVTARDVRVANPPGAAVGYMVRLRALEVKPALLPLLAGRIELRSVTLVEPEIDLEHLPDGTPNWSPPPAAPASSRARAPSAPVPSFAAAASAAFARLSVQNGALTWRGRDSVERFEHINAEATLDAESGQVAAAGNLAARGAAVTFDLRSGALDAASTPVQLTVTTKPAAQLQLDGSLTGPADDRRFAGKLTLKGDDIRRLLGTLAHVALPAGLAQPLATSADVAASASRLTLDHLVVDLGPVHGEGSFHVDAGPPPALALTLSIGQIDLDRWPPPSRAALAVPGAAFAETRLPGTSVPPPRGAVPASPFRRAAFAATPAESAGLDLPAGIDASVELGIGAVLWHGGLVRDTSLAVALAHGRLTLSRLSAQLPGGSSVSLSGSGAMTAQGPRAEAVVKATADDLRRLGAWLGVTLDAIPADRLRTASLSSRMTLAGDRLDVGAIDATVDATRLSGAATVLLRARPGIGLRIAADRFSLDAYLPQNVASPLPAPTPSGAAPAAAKEGALSRVDVNFDARAQAVTWHGQPVSDVHLAGTLQNGEVTISELGIGDLGGASANLSGVIEGLVDTPSGQLAFDMHGPELERVLRVVAPKLARGRRYGAFSLGGGLQYDPRTVTIDTDLQLLDGHAHVVGDIARSNGALDLGFDLDHPSLARLVRVFSPLYQPLRDPGAVKLAGRLEGDQDRFILDHLALAIGPSTLEGKVAVDRSAPRLQLDADLTAGDWAIDRLLSARQTAAIDRDLPRAASAPPIVLAAAAVPPADAGWSQEPFDLSVLRRADLELKLAAHSLAYGEWRIDSPSLTATVRDGALSLRQLTGDLLGGNVEVSGEASGAAAPALQGRITLRNAELDQLLRKAGGAGFIAGRFDIDAQLASAGGSEAELIAHLAGDAALRSGGGSLAGVDLKAMNERAATHTSDLATLLHSGAGGRTAFSTLEGSFHIAGGMASSDDLRVLAQDGDGRGAVKLDLPKWTMTSRVEFRLAAIADAPPLVMRLDGPIDAPRTIFDINALEQYLARRMAAPKAAAPSR